MAVAPAPRIMTVPAGLTSATEGSALVHTGLTPARTVPLESVTTAASWMVSPTAPAVSTDGVTRTLCARKASGVVPGTAIPAELV
jgi:hypothetical protein